jgi:hypothetical protein
MPGAALAAENAPAIPRLRGGGMGAVKEVRPLGGMEGGGICRAPAALA